MGQDFESNHRSGFGRNRRFQRKCDEPVRRIDLIVIHCSATREDRPFTEQDLENAHRLRGFDGIGYHFYVRRNGDIKSTRLVERVGNYGVPPFTVERVGAHVRGHNANSIGICYEGGLDCHGLAKDTRTEWQKHSLRVLVRALKMDYPEAKVVGHRDLSPDLNGNGEVEPMEWTKECPCFEVEKELSKKLS